MAAPLKKGLDYFPLSVHLLDEPKLRRPKMKYGYLAVVVFISLLGQLYRDKGYYLDYRDPDAVIWQVQSDLQGKYQPDYETVAEVIGALVACGLFSGDLYQRGIITSVMAQETYYRATATRKTVDIDDSLWLLGMADMEDISAKHCYYLKRVNDLNNGVNRLNNGVNCPDNPQSKVKKSKVNIYNTPTTNKLDSIAGGGVVDENICELFVAVKGAAVSVYEKQQLDKLAAEYGCTMLREALQVAGDNSRCNIAYIKGVLKNWQEHGKNNKPKTAKGAKGKNTMPEPSFIGGTDYSKFL